MSLGAVPNLSLRQRLHLKVFGCVFLRWQQLPGWVQANRVFVVNCREHGLFLDIEHGWTNHFHCPDCEVQLIQARRRRLKQ